MTNDSRRTPECPDAEALAALIDGQLDAEARARVEAHVAQCHDCYENFSETVRTSEEMSTAPAAGSAPVLVPSGRNPGRYRLVASASLIAAAAAVWLAVVPPAALVRWWSPNSRPELQELVAAVGTHRETEGRLTGGFLWGPPPSPARGATDAPLTPAAQIATARLTQAVGERRSPVSLAGYGTALLIARRPAEAVAALEAAVQASPQSPSLWSDLGTAYLARASVGAQSADLPRALDAVDQALALARLPEAAFTRSLVLERLDRRADAAAAWKQYLAVDSSSPWAVEARAHLQALETR